VRNIIIHAPEEAIPFDTEPSQESQYRLTIYLTMAMRLQKMEKKEVVACLLLAIGNIDVWDSYFVAVFLVINGGTVASEVEEVPWSGQIGQLLGLEVLLKPRNGQGTNAAHIYPGLQHGQRMRLLEFGKWLIKLKSTQSHDYILTGNASPDKLLQI